MMIDGDGWLMHVSAQLVPFISTYENEVYWDFRSTDDWLINGLRTTWRSSLFNSSIYLMPQ